MANTQVFTLGLGVTVINPLGQAIDLLRRDVERLRRQADGTRLGRLIGEVIRLGLELGKVRQVERQLALDQEQQHEDQIARLGDETEAVERLRQHYLMLDRVIAGLARLKPFKASLILSIFRASISVAREEKGEATDPQSDAATPGKAAPADPKVSLVKGAAVAAGLGLTALAGRRGAHEVIRRQPRNTQRRIARVARKEWQAHRVDAIGKVGKALVEGESGEEKAQGAGAAVGAVGGRVLGAVLARLTKSRQARKHGAEAGAYLGDAFGKWVGGKLYGWVTQATVAQPDTGAAPASPDPQAASALPAEQDQEPPQLAVARGAVVAAGLGLTALASRRGARAVMRRQPRNTQRRIARVAGKEWQKHRVDAIGKAGKALVEGESGEEQAQGVGAAVGEVGGRVLGAVLARLTKSRLARKHGAEAGAYLGDAFGSLVGGKLYGWVNQDAKAEPDAEVTPDPAAARTASAIQGSQVQAQPQAQEAATPQLTGQDDEAGMPVGLSLPSLLKKGAGIRLPGFGKLFKKVPGAALVDASLQMVETYNSDGTPAQKMDAYGSAAGGLGGTLAGAAAGAAIGSVVPVIGTAIGGLIGGVLGGMGGESAGGWLGRTVASITGNAAPGSSNDAAGQLKTARERADVSAPPIGMAGQTAQPVAPPTINQQFTFTANMPVTFNNSLDDPTTLQQLEAIARRMLEDLMRQARSVQMADQPQP
ncbi:hypothetical protein ACTORR_20790 [Pseudomonas sp. SAR267]|uniref:hypothetical protein n=1 Tax=unclassified Pseudomonas TaxID=196821 RepID=UPI0028B0B08B|nr:hypothetical protein [Pseudomonas sp.]